MTPAKLAEIIAAHSLWLSGNGGTRADLSGSYLFDANFSGANLSNADFSGSDLSVANFFGSNLSGADFSGSDLSGAHFFGANLSGANLSGSNLTGSHLFVADLSRAIVAPGIELTGSLPRRATRADGYEFFLWQTTVGWRVRVGCRFFSMVEAVAHWTATRVGTPLGDESLDILAYFQRHIDRSCRNHGKVVMALHAFTIRSIRWRVWNSSKMVATLPTYGRTVVQGNDDGTYSWHCETMGGWYPRGSYADVCDLVQLRAEQATERAP